MTSMKVSRTFARSGIRIFSILALFASVFSLLYTFHPRDEISRTSTIRLNFEWADSHQPETMESQGTSVIENWVASLDGVESFYSETYRTNGNITIRIQPGTSISEIISRLRFLFRLRRHELPENFSDIDFDQYDPDTGSLEILITMPLSSSLTKDLETYIVNLEGITGISSPTERNRIKASVSHPGLRKILDSAVTNEISAEDFTGFPANYQLKAREWNHWVAGRKWLPALLIRNTSYDFQPQVRLNGRASKTLRVNYKNIPEHRVVEHLRRWRHYDPKCIIINTSAGIRGYKLPMLLPTLALFAFMILIDTGMQIKERAFFAKNGIILTGTTLAIWAHCSGLWEDLPLAVSCLICSLLVLHRSSFFSFNLCGHLLKIIPLIAIVAIGGESKYLLLLIPWLAQVMMNRRFCQQQPDIPVGVRLNRIQMLFSLIALLALAFYTLSINEKTGIMDEFSRLPSLKYTHTKKHKSSVLVAYLFLGDQASSFTGSFIAELEKNILALVKTHGQLRIDILSERHVQIQVDAPAANLDAVRAYMSERSVMASGISWYISHGENSFSNRTAPLIPTFRWVINGYHRDSINAYGSKIREMLKKTARVAHLQSRLGGWLPETGSPKYNEYRKRRYHGHVFNGKIYKWKSEFADVIISTFPTSRWRLLHENTSGSGRLIRGHTIMASGQSVHGKSIIKKDRNFIWEIGHEYKGTQKMAETFMRETASKIDAMLPPGFSRLKEKGFHDSDYSNETDKILLLMVILLSWPLIVQNSPVESAVMIVSLAATLYYCLFIFNFLEAIPADWFDFVLLGAVIWILIAPARSQFRHMVLLPCILLVFDESESFRASLMMIAFAYTFTFLVSKLFAGEVSLLRIWNGLRSCRMN